MPGPSGGKRSPVVIGHVGTLSGPAGVTTAPVLDGARVWVKYINRRGGLNGHEVKLSVFDDGGDPARHRAQLQEAVERNGAIGFLVNTDPITGQSGVSYLESKRVPHVGTFSGITWAYDSPMYFPQMSDGEPGGYTWLAAASQQLVSSGKTKLATLVCVEAPGCSVMDRLWAEHAKSLGFQSVSRGKASIAQPDFTAECLSASNAGAQVMLILLDQNSVGRLASSCARQGFKPSFVFVSAMVDTRQKENPLLLGSGASSPVLPYFRVGTPAADEFQTAVKTFGGGIDVGVGTAIGWTAGKLLEKAGAALREPATNEDLLKGLWSIKNETLGGITGPISFVQDQKPVPIRCWFNLVLKQEGWTSPDSFAIQCR